MNISGSPLLLDTLSCGLKQTWKYLEADLEWTSQIKKQHINSIL